MACGSGYQFEIFRERSFEVEMDTRELAEKIAYLLLEKEFLRDEEIEKLFQVDDFEVIKAKNLLCRYYGIAYEKWHTADEISSPCLFLLDEFSGEDARETIYRVFHDPQFKTKKRLREEMRKDQLRTEVKEIYRILQEEL